MSGQANPSLVQGALRNLGRTGVGAMEQAVNALWDRMRAGYASAPGCGPDALDSAEPEPVSLARRHYERFPAFSGNKLITSVFDMIAGLYWEKMCASRGARPDLSAIDIEPLIGENDRNDPAAFYANTDLTPEIEFKRVARLPFIEISRGRFPSLIQTPFEENNTVHIQYYKQRRKPGGGPTVVMINGLYVDDYSYFDWWCWRFAAWGMSSVIIDLPYHVRRKPEGTFSGQLLLVPETDWSGLGLKQSFLDAHLLINWLNANGAGQVGLFGVSFGAWLAGVYVCQARNADFAIMAMPPMDAADLLSKLNFGDELREMELRGEMSMLTDPYVPRIFNMSTMRPKVANDKLFIARGVYDSLVDPRTIEQTCRAWGGVPWLMDYPAGHINTYVLNPKFDSDVRRFVLTEVLGRELRARAG